MTNPHASKPYPSRMTIVRLASAAVFLLLGSGAGSAASFDGHWSVVIITESGSCDPAYRYRLRIQNGVVHYDGEADVNVSGRVDPNGAVRVSVARGQQRADGAGRRGGGRCHAVGTVGVSAAPGSSPSAGLRSGHPIPPWPSWRCLP